MRPVPGCEGRVLAAPGLDQLPSSGARRGVGFLYKAPRGWGGAALGSGSVRALCCRGENGFSPDPVSALGLFEVTMCFSSPVQQSPGRLQKECSVQGQQQILSPVQGLEPRSRVWPGRAAGAEAPWGAAAWGECCVRGSCHPSGLKPWALKRLEKRELGSTGWLCPHGGFGWAGTGTGRNKLCAPLLPEQPLWGLSMHSSISPRAEAVSCCVQPRSNSGFSEIPKSGGFIDLFLIWRHPFPAPRLLPSVTRADHTPGAVLLSCPRCWSHQVFPWRGDLAFCLTTFHRNSLFLGGVIRGS